MHWSLWGVSHPGLAKFFNCNQILGHVADQDYIEGLLAETVLHFHKVTDRAIKLFGLVVKTNIWISVHLSSRSHVAERNSTALIDEDLLIQEFKRSPERTDTSNSFIMGVSLEFSLNGTGIHWIQLTQGIW